MDAPPISLGLDIGKTHHHAVARTATGTVVLDRRLANDQAALEAVFADAGRWGPVQVCVDQPGSIGALTVAVAQAHGLPVSYLPGRRMRQVANTFAGQTKTDARDAAIISEAARSMPHTIRPLVAIDPVIAELRLVSGQDDDLAKHETALTNRLRGLLNQLHPPLEQVVGPRLDNAGVLPVLQRWPTPPALGRLGQRRLTDQLRRAGSRRAPTLAADIIAAVRRQTVVLPGTAQLSLILPQLAEQLLLLRRLRAALAATLELLLAQVPQAASVRSMPGFGLRTTARTVVELAGKTFASAGHLAAYAGIAPVTRQTGASRAHHRRSRHGNRALQRAWFLTAVASLTTDRTYYDRKRREGLPHPKATIALARRRVDVLFALLRDGTLYAPKPALPNP